MVDKVYLYSGYAWLYEFQLNSPIEELTHEALEFIVASIYKKGDINKILFHDEDEAQRMFIEESNEDEFDGVYDFMNFNNYIRLDLSEYDLPSGYLNVLELKTNEDFGW